MLFGALSGKFFYTCYRIGINFRYSFKNCIIKNLPDHNLYPVCCLMATSELNQIYKGLWNEIDGDKCKNGGEGGIRTHGTLTRTTVFETAPFNRSGTSPRDQTKKASSRGFYGSTQNLKSGKRGSNSRPTPWQGVALPTELFPQKDWYYTMPD